MSGSSFQTLQDSFNVGVLQHKGISGIDSLQEANDAEGLITEMTLLEAMEYEWHTDAYITCYVVPDEEVWPRLNKHVLPEIIAGGKDVLCPFYCVDFDVPKHAEISREWYDEFVESLEVLEGPASEWCIMYTTLHGARLVYLFDEPIPALRVEEYIRGLFEDLKKGGLDPDYGASDWNNLFRLPKVDRDGARTEEHPLFIIDYTGSVCETNRITPRDKGDITTLPRQRINKDAQIDVDGCMNLLEVCKDGKMIKTEWYKRARKRLKGRECYDTLFNDVVLADLGSRDETLLSYVGSAITMMWGIMGTTHHHIFALFYHPVAQFDQDQDWITNLWSKVCRLWEQERVQQAASEIYDDEILLTKTEKQDSISRGMLEWCEHPSLQKGASIKAKDAFIKRHAIASNGTTYYCMGKDGRYEGFPQVSSSVVPRVQLNGMADVIGIWRETENGMRKKTANDIISDCTTPVNEIEMMPQIKGGFIQDMDSQFPILRLCSYRRNPNLTPQYNEEVDTWLILLAGQNYQSLCQWIGYALAFEDGSTCALSIRSAPGIGKNMLAQGLAECLERPFLAEANDLTGDFQGSLLKTPFVYVDEGWPRSRSEDISVRFRSMIANGSFLVNEKHRPKMRVFNPVRILMTANDESVLHDLTDGKDLSFDSRQALVDRLFHMEGSVDAAKWLRERGGKSFTGRDGRRWIASECGRPSDFIVARHFLYLYATRDRYKPGTRFLMEGNVGSKSGVMQQLITKTGSTPLVLETLIGLMESSKAKGRGIAIVEGKVYVLAQAILAHFRMTLANKTREDLTLIKIEKVLKNIRSGVETIRVIPGHEKDGMSNWYELDMDIVLGFAQDTGHKSQVLRALLEGK